MYLIPTLVSSILLATGAIAQSYNYGGSYGSGSSGSDSSSGGGTDYGAASTSTASAAVSKTTAQTGPKETLAGGDVKVQVVKVSNKNGNLTFAPNNITAAIGSFVQFHFYPKNHSVVQSTFDNPCVPFKNASKPDQTGFFSGFMPVKADATELPAYTIKINDTKPIWYYCSQAKHCQGGMVGVINPPAANKSRTIDTFAALAKNAPQNLSPTVIANGGPSSSGSSSSSAGLSSILSTLSTSTTQTFAATAFPTSSASSIVNTSVATFPGSGNTVAASKQNLLLGFCIFFALFIGALV
ncbi:hypothetical protein MMC31_000266 [Peltigera leucophlebia]|nr:hypothetical protein [Peltigera leucophlebia]